MSDPFGFMMRARLAVCASVYEGLGNAIIEALACGTPVVSTDCPYGPSEILQGGRLRRADTGRRCAGHGGGDSRGIERGSGSAALMARGLNYTAERAAERFLEIVAELRPLQATANGPLAVARAS